MVEFPNYTKNVEIGAKKKITPRKKMNLEQGEIDRSDRKMRRYI